VVAGFRLGHGSASATEQVLLGLAKVGTGLDQVDGVYGSGHVLEVADGLRRQLVSRDERGKLDCPLYQRENNEMDLPEERRP
jgi:hypothetical protein